MTLATTCLATVWPGKIFSIGLTSFDSKLPALTLCECSVVVWDTNSWKTHMENYESRSGIKLHPSSTGV